MVVYVVVDESLSRQVRSYLCATRIVCLSVCKFERSTKKRNVAKRGLCPFLPSPTTGGMYILVRVVAGKGTRKQMPAGYYLYW